MNEKEDTCGELPEYELAGIENIVRGVCVRDGYVLLCRPKKGGYTYLPGGHIEFGETSRAALAREMKEETGLDAAADEFLGVVESQFEQHGQRHCEISLVYRLSLKGQSPRSPELPTVVAQEDWIEFAWWPIARLREANLLPAEMARYVG